MPTRPPLPCPAPGCPVLMPEGGRCPRHRSQQNRAKDQERGTGTADGREGVAFTCPGCQSYHVAWIAAPEGGVPVWGYNGDDVRPTLTPSLLVRWNWGEERHREVCHSFVRDGQIEFLSDCTHALAGHTVPLPPIPVTEAPQP